MYFLHKKTEKLYITDKLGKWSKYLNTDFTLGNWLFGAVKLTNNPDLDNTNIAATA